MQSVLGRYVRPHAFRALASLLGAAALGAGCDSRGGPTPGPSAQVSPAPTAPAYAAPRLGGDTLRLAELRGHVVLLTTWATWCGVCEREVPALQALHGARSGEGLRVVGVSLDARRDTGAVRSFVRRHGLTFPVLLDPEDRVGRAFGLRSAVPQSVLIDRAGREVHRWYGSFPADHPGALGLLTRALAGEGAP